MLDLTNLPLALPKGASGWRFLTPYQFIHFNLAWGQATDKHGGGDKPIFYLI